MLNNPSVVDHKLLFLEVELKPNHASLKPEQKYRVVGGFDLTMAEAQKMLGPAVLAAHAPSHEVMKKKGGLGVSPMIIAAKGVVDVVGIRLNTLDNLKKVSSGPGWYGGYWVLVYNPINDQSF